MKLSQILSLVILMAKKNDSLNYHTINITKSINSWTISSKATISVNPTLAGRADAKTKNLGDYFVK